MSRGSDPNAPLVLTIEERGALYSEPVLVEMRANRKEVWDLS
jgi:hypothetical protein